MRWPFWAIEKKDESPAPAPSTPSSRLPEPAQDTTSGNQPSSWSSPRLPTSWTDYTTPEALFPALIITTSILVSRRLYKLYLRRFTGASNISPSFWRKRSLLGHVTSVGDGDGFRLFHTPGGRLAGWGWLPGRSIPGNRSVLKGQTISVRLAGVDAPEGAHFGHPAQPGGKEALQWLTSYLLGRTVRAYIWRKDQYDRAVATVYVRRWGGLISRDVGLVMLKKGLATVYEAKQGAEFGTFEERYRRAEFWAKFFKRGIWRNQTETPREYKDKWKMEDKRKADEGVAVGSSQAKASTAMTASKSRAESTTKSVSKEKAAQSSSSDRKTARTTNSRKGQNP